MGFETLHVSIILYLTAIMNTANIA